MQPRILFFTSNEEDYLSDSLLHGLRLTLGAAVVDFPKNELLYDTASAQLKARAHGTAFTLYGRLPDVPVDRYHVFRRAILGEFDLIVFSDIHRQFGYLAQLWGHRRLFARTKLAIVDGSDWPEPFPQALRYLKRPETAFMPRLHDVPYFKREVDASTARAYYYRAVPARLSPRLRLPRNVLPISFSIPEDWLVSEPPAKTKDFAEHVVDREVASRLGRQTDRRYTFDNEADYQADLRSSRFGITTKRAGWDCLRHYEIAASGAVPCFRELDRKPERCAPHGLDRDNTLIYRDADDLFAQTARLTPEQYAQLQGGALSWARRNTTRARAREFLAALGMSADG